MAETEAVRPGEVADGSRPGQAGRSFLLIVLFFLSGLAALIYQIVWAKQLSLVFGVTIYATSAVVSAYMAGLAFGSLFFGRVADRWRNPLRLFALLELGIGVFALAFPFIVGALKPVYSALYGSLGDSFYVMSLLRFALSFGVLLVPTFLMGGTLPVITKAYVARPERVGRRVAGLYSANNMGAFLGCVATGYALLELLGNRGTILVGATITLAVAAAAWLLKPLEDGSAPEAARRDAEALAEDTPSDPLPGPVGAALWIFGIEGFTSLAYQMSWTRLLIFFVETNIYAMTTIVSTFLIGLALGAFLVRRRLARSKDLFRLLGFIEAGIAVTALASVPLIPSMLRHYGEYQTTLWRWGWAGWTAARFTITFLVILVPTAFMGATLPVVSSIYISARKGLGTRMGVVGCLDTVGSIFGAFAGAFVLIPLLGIQRSIIAIALVNLALAFWAFGLQPAEQSRRSRRVLPAAAAILIALAAAMLFLKPVPLVRASRALRSIREGQILYYNEDVESTVSVVEAYDQYKLLLIDHASGAQTGRFDRISHEMVGHIPLLCHPDPERALVIGCGIGFTTWACTTHGVDVDVVELSPGVKEANVLFEEDNNYVFHRPDVTLRIEDGRNFVLGTDHTYDMIQSGIIHPALNSGQSSFYTVDFYEECRRIMTPDAVMSQWLPLHMMPHEDFKMLIRSCLEVFPHTSVWFKNTAQYCILVSTEKPLRLDFRNIERRMTETAVGEHLKRSSVINVYDLLDAFCCADEDLRRAVGDGPLHTDNRPLMEFHSQRPISRFAYADNIALLAQAREPVWPMLVNVPEDRESSVQSELAKWFESTNAMLTGFIRGAELAALRPGDARYWEMLDRMNAAFRMALKLNPNNQNARMAWEDDLCAHALIMGHNALREGDRETAAREFAFAAQTAPWSYNGAEARYMLRVLRDRFGVDVAGLPAETAGRD